MLVIRQEQLRAFGAEARHDFASEMLPLVRSCFPARVRALGSRELVDVLERGIDHAERRGFVEQRHVFQFVCVRLVLGDTFDSDPRWAWAARILDSSASADEKLALLLTAIQALGGSHDV